jgi:NADH:ubiquinone oxidoreductase subunit F (NADH-binding)/NAD-dependent dihydropyrimidine dehydrogenase PreA subunit
MPTVLNNVETLANIPGIVRKGPDWFKGLGLGDAAGTKVFALSGRVKNTGLVEVPVGIPLREVVYGIGGGAPEGHRVKAVQIGGPSGGCIPDHLLDIPTDYGKLQELGAMMGSGGMIVMDEHDCMVDIARFYLGFCVDESCGKCAPCRIGGYQMLRILDKIADGRGEMSDIDNLKRLAAAMKRGSLCGLGQTAANPVLSTLRYFAEEYREHIEDKKCRALKCRSLFSYKINQEKCKRCSLCVRNCPVEAIPGDRKTGYTIDTAKCVKCGQCVEACRFAAIEGA